MPAETAEKENDRETLIYLHIFRCVDGEDLTNEWCLIKQTSKTAEISQVFQEIPQHNPGGGLIDTDCQVVGSSLYIIGGYDHDSETCSNAIRCLDTCNPCKGWQTCFSLPFDFAPALTGVCGRWIYVFVGERKDFNSSYPWGYVLNIDGKEVYQLERPSDSSIYPQACALLESESGLLLLVYMPEHNKFYLHDPLKNTWEFYHQDEFNPSLHFRNYVFSDGIMYFHEVDRALLHAYDTKLRKRLPPIQLPCSEWFGYHEIVHLVSLASGKLCLIWGEERLDICCLLIYYTKFSVVYDKHDPYIIVEVQKCFKIDGLSLVNCVALEPRQGGVTVNPKRLLQDELLEQEEKKKGKKDGEPIRSFDADGSLLVAG